jgi:hypothetical protein
LMGDLGEIDGRFGGDLGRLSHNQPQLTDLFFTDEKK